MTWTPSEVKTPSKTRGNLLSKKSTATMAEAWHEEALAG
jgi:hypothetical protein